MGVDRPDIRENAVCGRVTKRKVGGGREPDRDCRDGFLGLAQICDKLKVLFWDDLGARPAVPGGRAPRRNRSSPDTFALITLDFARLTR